MSTSTHTPREQEEDIIHIYCNAENAHLCFKISFLNILLEGIKFSFSLADALFKLSLVVNTGKKTLSEI